MCRDTERSVHPTLATDEKNVTTRRFSAINEVQRQTGGPESKNTREFAESMFGIVVMAAERTARDAAETNSGSRRVEKLDAPYECTESSVDSSFAR